jgi:hypothetical protein
VVIEGNFALADGTKVEVAPDKPEADKPAAQPEKKDQK